MINDYIKEFKQLGKKDTTKDDLKFYDVKLKDLRAIIKRDNLKNNNELGLTFVNSDCFDLIVMGYIFMDTKNISYEDLITLINKTNSDYIKYRHLSIFISENDNFEKLINYLKENNNLGLYYSAIDGKLMMDPFYDETLIKDLIKEIKTNIYTSSEEVMLKMNSLISTIAVQSPNHTKECLDLYETYKSKLSNVKFSDTIKFYKGSEKANLLQKKRKSCRC